MSSHGSNWLVTFFLNKNNLNKNGKFRITGPTDTHLILWVAEHKLQQTTNLFFITSSVTDYVNPLKNFTE